MVAKKDSKEIDILGATFERVKDDELSRLGIDNGVMVKKIRRGELMNKGVREGFIITHIDKAPVVTTDDIIRLLNGTRGGVLLEGTL